MRLISVILGILLIAGGVMSIVSPGAVALNLGALIGLYILIHGVGTLINQTRFRHWGSDGWAVGGAILAILIGAALMTSARFQWLTNLAVVFMAGLWILAAGIVCVATAFRMRRFSQALPWEKPRTSWLWLLLLGVLLIAMGILAYVHLMLGIVTIGVMLGVYVISAGIHLIALSCCPARY